MKDLLRTHRFFILGNFCLVCAIGITLYYQVYLDRKIEELNKAFNDFNFTFLQYKFADANVLTVKTALDIINELGINKDDIKFKELQGELSKYQTSRAILENALGIKLPAFLNQRKIYFDNKKIDTKSFNIEKLGNELRRKEILRRNCITLLSFLQIFGSLFLLYHGLLNRK